MEITKNQFTSIALHANRWYVSVSRYIILFSFNTSMFMEETNHILSQDMGKQHVGEIAENRLYTGSDISIDVFLEI